MRRDMWGSGFKDVGPYNTHLHSQYSTMTSEGGKYQVLEE